jgi:hypothetical protein
MDHVDASSGKNEIVIVDRQPKETPKRLFGKPGFWGTNEKSFKTGRTPKQDPKRKE